jgi:hypothetical protein
MFHTRFFGIKLEATKEFERMKQALTEILEMIPRTDDPEVDAKSRGVCDAISTFVANFP